MVFLETVAAVQMKHVTKRFGSVIANDSVSLDINKGEILSLLGENGSGKTTLMNMLAGIYFPDEGEILVNGSPVTIASPKDAYEHGIGMIHQHFKMCIRDSRKPWDERCLLVWQSAAEALCYEILHDSYLISLLFETGHQQPYLFFCRGAGVHHTADLPAAQHQNAVAQL